MNSKIFRIIFVCVVNLTLSALVVPVASAESVYQFLWPQPSWLTSSSTSSTLPACPTISCSSLAASCESAGYFFQPVPQGQCVDSNGNVQNYALGYCVCQSRVCWAHTCV